MEKVKALHNKTIDTDIAAGEAYLSRCIRIKRKVEQIAEIENKTVIGDSFGVMEHLPRGCFDLIIADPPYNLTKEFAGRTFRKMDVASYEEYTRKWLSLAAPLLKEGGSIYVCCDWESSLIIGRVLSEFFTVRNRITWQREKGRGSQKNWKNGMEDIWFATKGSAYTFNAKAVKVRKKVVAPYRENGKPKDWVESGTGRYRDTYASNFWDDITIPFWSMAENTAHPTQKSEKLIAKLILASSKRGELIFDPFAGSGTVSVVAKKLGRRYIGIERSKQYAIWCEQRLEMADTDKRIQGYDEGVFWERSSGR